MDGSLHNKVSHPCSSDSPALTPPGKAPRQAVWMNKANTARRTVKSNKTNNARGRVARPDRNVQHIPVAAACVLAKLLEEFAYAAPGA